MATAHSRLRRRRSTCAGVGGQTVLMIPSHQLAIVRLGHYKGSIAGDRTFRDAVQMLLDEIAAA